MRIHKIFKFICLEEYCFMDGFGRTVNPQAKNQ